MNDHLKALADRLAALPWYRTGLPTGFAPYLGSTSGRVRSNGGLPRIAFELLAALGLSGWSLRYDLVAAVNYYRQQEQKVSGTYLRAQRLLAERGLWETRPTRIDHQQSILVRLTDLGRTLLTEAGLAVQDSEWDVVEAQHRRAGDGSQMGHTAAICMFLHFARLRGYTTVACPVGAFGKAEPDALITLAAQNYYVEVQRLGGDLWKRHRKWEHQAGLQGFSAICAETPRRAAQFAREAQQGAQIAYGVVTDLVTLSRRAPPNLWTQRWRSPHMPLELVTEADGLPLLVR